MELTTFCLLSPENPEDLKRQSQLLGTSERATKEAKDLPGTIGEEAWVGSTVVREPWLPLPGDQP